MGSKNKQRSSKLAQASVTRRITSRNPLADAISGINTGLSDSLSTAIKGGVCSVALGTVVSSGMFAAPAAHAQDGAGTIEEVTVMGIRGSLKRALDLKRDADGIVDAISAEDMGKFPDTNLAESLQRITGVSIDRSRGEGSKITVRGLGPEFNLVLFNGRQMPTQSGGNRSFDFANIASEGVSAVEVYKSSNAKISTGGMGATVNVRTSRPLQDPGMSASAGVKFVHDESTEAGNSLTPEISGIYSNTFLDDTVGVAISASLQKRDSGLNTANVGPGWRSFRGSDTGSNTLPNNASQTNRPGPTDIYGVPQNTGYRIEEFQRERINGQLTLQWQPLDSVTATVDYTYAELDLSRQFSDLSAWYGGGNQITTYTDGPLASPIIYSEVPGQGDFAMAIGEDASINENNSMGFNVEWQPTERLALVLDYHDSDAESRPDSRFGTSANITLASYNRIGTRTWFNAGEIPVLQVDLDPQPNGRGLDPETLQVSGSVFGNSRNKMEIEQTSLSGDFEINELSSIDFGVQLTKIDNRALSSNVQRNTWGQSPAAPGDISDLLSPASIAGRFDELSGGNDPRLQTDYLTVSMGTLVDRIEQLIAADPGDADSNGRPDGLDTWSPGGGITNNLGDCGTGFCASTDFDSKTLTKEDTKS
ncbi:MAG: TonB-dependent receptor, partial [Gammaproteobacteria bacterium]|nr:TonB-dependent receptor [Gammaproteobacteria bacterium]